MYRVYERRRLKFPLFLSEFKQQMERSIDGLKTCVWVYENSFFSYHPLLRANN